MVLLLAARSLPGVMMLSKSVSEHFSRQRISSAEHEMLRELILENVVIAPILAPDLKRSFAHVEARAASGFCGLML